MHGPSLAAHEELGIFEEQGCIFHVHAPFPLPENEVSEILRDYLRCTHHTFENGKAYRIYYSPH